MYIGYNMGLNMIWCSRGLFSSLPLQKISISQIQIFAPSGRTFPVARDRNSIQNGLNTKWHCCLISLGNPFCDLRNSLMEVFKIFHRVTFSLPRCLLPLLHHTHFPLCLSFHFSALFASACLHPSGGHAS